MNNLKQPDFYAGVVPAHCSSPTEAGAQPQQGCKLNPTMELSRTRSMDWRIEGKISKGIREEESSSSTEGGVVGI